MACQTQPPKVLIIGAGLAGLCLAQGLKYADPAISFQVFERDASTSFRAQGYRIRISPEGAATIRKLLPPHLWHAFETTCAAVAPGVGSRLDALSGSGAEWTEPPPSASNMRPPPQFVKGKAYNADRAVLRNVLLSGLDDRMTFGKKFLKYHTNSDGTVQAHFDDGSSVCGSILVGADGSRSAVRRQLLPHFEVLDTEGRVVFGKTYLTPEVRERIPAEMTEGLCLIGENHNNHIKLFCDLMKFHDGLDAETTARFQIPADYVYWVLCFRKDMYPGADSDLLSLTCAESRLVSLELAESWHETVRALLEHQHTESASTLALYTCTAESLVAQWEGLEPTTKLGSGTATLMGGPITLLGDAAHPMPPVGGVGANTAFQEALDLCMAITKVYCASGAWEKPDALMAYQGLMMERAAATIKSSIGGAGRFFGMKPLEELKATAF